jgi:hypothetical protein
MARIVYVVEAEGIPTRLIEATQSTQALAYAARTTYAVRKASQQDLIKLLREGVSVEASVAEPDLFEPEPQVAIDPAGNVVTLAA